MEVQFAKILVICLTSLEQRDVHERLHDGLLQVYHNIYERSHRRQAGRLDIALDTRHNIPGGEDVCQPLVRRVPEFYVTNCWKMVS